MNAYWQSQWSGKNPYEGYCECAICCAECPECARTSTCPECTNANFSFDCCTPQNYCYICQQSYRYGFEAPTSFPLIHSSPQNAPLQLAPFPSNYAAQTPLLTTTIPLQLTRGSPESQGEEEEENEEETEDNWELAPELLEMFAKTERKRMERKRKRQQEHRKQQVEDEKVASETPKYVEEKSANQYSMREKKLREQLYGSSKQQVQTIEAVESALNTLYNRVIEMRHPIIWPEMPLNVSL